MQLAPFVVLTALALAGCQTAPPTFEVPRGGSYSASKEEVWRRTFTALRDHGLEVRSAHFDDGRLGAALEGFADHGWAWCERARVVDRSSNTRRFDWARPVDRDLALLVEVMERDGLTEVTLDADFTETQIDPYRNLPLIQGCLSTGELERSLLAAI
jgi:hypothetical protein